MSFAPNAVNTTQSEGISPHTGGLNGSGINPGVSGELPVMDARRMLIIGIGSSGTRVCNQVLERLQTVYRTPGNLPWVRCYCLETAPVAADYAVHRYAQFRHLTISRDGYRTLLNIPNTFDAQMDYQRWNIGNLTRTADQLNDGANNIRILGRLALLYPQNFLDVRNDIQAHINALDALNTETAREHFNATSGEGENVDIHLSSQIFIYVVGTLAGGTASGAFIDIGYLLRGLTYNNLNTVALLHLPSTNHNNNTQIGNSMAALRELNHFNAPGNRFNARYAHMPGIDFKSDPGQRPFDFQYLVQTTANTGKNYAQLLTATADYLFADVIGSSGLVRDGFRTNILGHFATLDAHDAPQKFMTMGLAAIEFPYLKVRRACALKLTGQGIRLALGAESSAGGVAPPAKLDEKQWDTLMARTPLVKRERLEEYLLTIKSGDTIANRLNQAILEASSKGARSDATLAQIRQQIANAFTVDDTNVRSSDMPAGLPVGIVPLTISSNTQAAISEIVTSIENVVHDRLVNPVPNAIPLLCDYLIRIEEQITKAQNRTGKDSTTTREADIAAHQKNARLCRNDIFLAILMARSEATEYYIKRYFTALSGLANERQKWACTDACRNIYERTLTYVRRLRTRISDPGAGLTARLAHMGVAIEDLLKRTNTPSGADTSGWSRVIKGRELYQPDQLNEEYTVSLQEKMQQEGITEMEIALQSVQAFLKDAAEAVLMSVTRTSPLDPGSALGKWDDIELMERCTPAWECFERLNQVSVIQRLLTRQDSAEVLDETMNESHVLLDLNLGGGRFLEALNKRGSYVFYDTKDSQVSKFQNLLGQPNRPLRNLTRQPWKDKHQILFLQELGAFSLGTIVPLDDVTGEHWWNRYEQPELQLPGNPSMTHVETLHSRGDIRDWTDWKRSRLKEERNLRNLFLIGIALGLITERNADRFEYRPIGHEVILFNRDLKSAIGILRGMVRDLGMDPVAVGTLLENDVAEYTRLKRMTDVAARIRNFIPTTNNKFTSGGVLLSKDNIFDYMDEYINKIPELKQEFLEDADFASNAAERLREKEPDFTGQYPYLCPGTGSCSSPGQTRQILGYNSDCLYDYERKGDVTLKILRCAICKQQFASARSGVAGTSAEP